MARLLVLMFLLVIFTCVWTQEEVRENYFEKCWDDIGDCIRAGPIPQTSYINQCRLRCQCLGNRTGYCKRIRSCKFGAGHSWRCECMGSLIRYHSLLLDLCKDVNGGPKTNS